MADLMLMATIENVNTTLKEVLSVLEDIKQELHEIDERTLQLTGYDDGDDDEDDNL